MVGVLDVMGKRVSSRYQFPLSLCMLLVAIGLHMKFSFVPLNHTKNLATQVWQANRTEKQIELARIYELYFKSPNVSMTAHDQLVPTFSFHETIYMFPNPFRRKFYGVGDEPLSHLPYPEYVLLDSEFTTDEMRSWIPSSYRRLDGIRYFELYRLMETK